MNRPDNEILLCDTAWWIVHRGRIWGPFDYQWSSDLRGIELTYQGRKFGEVCSREEFFADLAPFRIPLAVSRVAAIVAGSLAVSISAAEDLDARGARLTRALEDLGYGRFLVRHADEFPEQPPHRSAENQSP